MDFDKYDRGMDKMGMKGKINLVHFRGGMPFDERDVDNLVVTTGKAGAAGLFCGEKTDFFEYLAIGTGTTSPAAGNTSLTAIAGARASATVSLGTTTVANDTAQLVATFNFNAATAITEAGIFDASTNGTLATHATFSPINVASGDSLQLTYKVAFA